MEDKHAFPSDAADKVLVRMPDGMRDSLKKAAKANNRTMNAEIIARLQLTFDETIVTTVEARARLGPEEKRVQFNADEIAAKVVERLTAQAADLQEDGNLGSGERQSAPRYIIIGNLGREGGVLPGFERPKVVGLLAKSLGVNDGEKVNVQPPSSLRPKPRKSKN